METQRDPNPPLAARLASHPALVGPQGLRPGWGCLLFLILLVALSYLAHVLAAALIPHHPALQPSGVSPRFLLTGESLEVATVLLATVAMARFEGRKLRSYGLAAQGALPRAAWGFIYGFAAISALVGLLWATHVLVLGGLVLHGWSIVRYGLLWALGFSLVGCFEELLLRGYWLFTLARGIRFWPAAFVLSALFGLIHRSNAGETPIGLFSAGAVGLLFCLSIWYTGSLWWAIGFHAAWDWGESFFWGTSDSGTVVQGHLLLEHPAGNRLLSGGATGPEGSLLVFPVLLVCAALVALWWGRRGRQDPAALAFPPGVL